MTAAATYLCLGQNTVRSMLQRGELAGWLSRGGKRWLVSRVELDRYIARMETEARADREYLARIVAMRGL